MGIRKSLFPKYCFRNIYIFWHNIPFRQVHLSQRFPTVIMNLSRRDKTPSTQGLGVLWPNSSSVFLYIKATYLVSRQLLVYRLLLLLLLRVWVKSGKYCSEEPDQFKTRWQVYLLLRKRSQETFNALKLNSSFDCLHKTQEEGSTW